MIELNRDTLETKISLKLGNNGEPSDIQSGVGFLDHMLTLFTFHSGLSLQLLVDGDTEVDDHHSVEDIGILLGQAIMQLYQEQKYFDRYGSFYIPMDESLARCVTDISGRPYLSFNADFSKEKVGTFDTELVEEFFRALVINARMTVHIDLLRQGNTHHEIEAVFKAFARSLKIALNTSSARIESSKGVIE